MVTSFQLKGLDKSMSRLRYLEKYCSDLLQCDTTVSHSTEVIQFFLPTEQELQTEYTQNRYVDYFPAADKQTASACQTHV